MQTHQELKYYLALHHTPGIGAQTLLLILEHLSDLSQLFIEPVATARELGLKESITQHLLNPPWEKVEKDLRWLEQSHQHILTLRDEKYPLLLRQIAVPPPVLFVKGNLELLSTLQLAMVGSRNPSALGNELAFNFAQYLAKQDLTITSGLALGIDAASHRGALAAAGQTIAVLGTGLDVIYPAQHQALAAQIAEQGALVSEFSPGTTPRAENFPRRNRIISGMSLGVLVVEAALRSGSLITARNAIEQGREVFAIPGSIHNPLARGCHSLIRQGAKLVETAEDIIEELRPQSQLLSARTGVGTATQLNDSEYTKLLNCMGFDTVSIDVLITRSGLTAEAVSSMLLILELQGIVRVLPGGYAITHTEQASG